MNPTCKIAYGLDVAPTRVVLARVAGRVPLAVMFDAAPGSEEAVRALTAVMREVEKGTAVLAVAAPAAPTAVRVLRAPFASLRKAARIWSSLLDVELPFPVEAASCAYSQARIDNGATRVVAAAIRHPDLAAFEEACLAVGFSPTHCDAEATALWNQLALEASPARPGQPRILVWIGADHVLILRGQGRDFLAAHVLRTSPWGGDSAAASFEAAWPARIQHIVATHARETASTEIDFWWGGLDAAPADRLARLRPPCSAGGMTTRHETLPQPGSFLARALARGAWDGSGINFKTGEQVHPARVRALARQRRFARWGVLAAAGVVVLLNWGESALVRRRDAALQRQLTAEAAAMTGTAVPRGQERLMVERALDRRDEATRPFRAALAPEGMEGRLSLALESALALDLQISRLSISPIAIAVEGTAPGIQAVEQYADRLRAQGWAVQPDTPGRAPDGRPRFVLKGAARHEG